METKPNIILVIIIVIVVSLLTSGGTFLVLNSRNTTAPTTTDNTVTIPNIKTISFDDAYFANCSGNAISDTELYRLSESFDASTLDSNVWFNSEKGNVISQGNLVQTSSDPLEASWISSNSFLKGDFRMDVAFNSFTAVDSVKNKDAIFYIKAIAKNLDFFNIVVSKNFRGISIALGGINGSSNGMPYYTNTPVYFTSLDAIKTLRLERIGTTAYAYADFGSGFVELGKQERVTDSAVSIGLGNQNFSIEKQSISTSVSSITAVGCKDLV